ncbi:MAG: helix-turn-helix transcriptional regulator [Gemmatimonadales bacterium]
MLVELTRETSLTAKDLAERLSLSLNAVRHHLKELEAEGLILYHREQRGVGAPTFAYYLSPVGEALFPQRYKEVLTEVLDRVVATGGRAAVVEALEGRFTELSRRLRAEVADAPPSRRMEVVLQALVEGGFMAEWEERKGTFHLTEHNCAIRAVAERFPEICAAEARFLQEVLAAVVEREAHILRGCSACEYSVRFPTSAAFTELQGWEPGRIREEQA